MRTPMLPDPKDTTVSRVERTRYELDVDQIEELLLWAFNSLAFHPAGAGPNPDTTVELRLHQGQTLHATITMQTRTDR